ncbi:MULTISPECIES: class I SAM-dependent methyltransferase [Deefgea]|uniref:Methyltransferase domain-containing protein n=1 Tax=Deefgea chitinilytica TaxID=570276 RepID=A0ABS2CB82_9NEIS|nr:MULTISPECIES: class I SAM-dependent methyltransferase [Deefgea]MBM5571404.1 methyltransferase domain-containing protein [Deefgea chitinilytica]MBM9888637.1 class I SAM-dependent methyltransferase [Deefgea sp. CFH1-16]
MGASRNWFEQGGEAYARFRPEYPPELAQFLASISKDKALALDVGCGNGQLTRQLAQHFDQVLGLDPSSDQIAHAIAHPRVQYACAPAEQLPLADHSVNLITAAQAAHWFDLPRFYAQVWRVASSNALLALISYGVLRLDEELDARFGRFYWQEIGPYWPAERKLVDSGYADLPFPFAEQVAPELAICKAWKLDELLGYISTWSAVRRVREASREDILQNFATELRSMWGDPSQYRAVRWPIKMRLGML